MVLLTSFQCIRFYKSHSSTSQYFCFDFTAPLENKTHSGTLSVQNNIYEKYYLFQWTFLNNSVEYINSHAQQTYQLPPLAVLWIMLQSRVQAHREHFLDLSKLEDIP